MKTFEVLVGWKTSTVRAKDASRAAVIGLSRILRRKVHAELVVRQPRAFAMRPTFYHMPSHNTAYVIRVRP